MEDQLLRLRDEDMARLAPIVKASLHEELLSRYVGSKALAEHRLTTDPVILTTRSLLADPARLTTLLSGRP
jgi:hypothetical protein